MRALGDLVCHLIRFGGLAWLIRHTIARRRAGIVVFHDPDPATFESQLRYLRDRYSLVSHGDLLAALEPGRWDLLPKRPLVVHLDDGRRGNLALAAALGRLEAKPTLFACSDLLGDERMLTVGQLDELAELVEVGSHSRTHPALPACDGRRAEEEIAGSRRELERILGRACSDFAYPAGAYGEREVELVRRAGYRSARTVDVGWIGPGADRHRLRLLSIDPSSLSRLAAELSGFKWLSRLLNREGGLDGRRRFGRSGRARSPRSPVVRSP